jgi:hypothetical protein
MLLEKLYAVAMPTDHTFGHCSPTSSKNIFKNPPIPALFLFSGYEQDFLVRPDDQFV